MIDYSKMAKRINDDNGLVRALNILDKAITYITAFLYMGLLTLLTVFSINDFSWINQLIISVLVPGVSFIVVSLYRKLVSAPRPYEVYDFKPALEKDTKGKSFPSRHVFSIFIVAMTFLQMEPIVAVLLFAFGVVLAIIRVIGGVHFVHDVIAGAAIAIITGILGYYILYGVFHIGMIRF